jgi:TetR/AcrR family transcriptional regulator, transcriptional repressor for nem operon
MTRRTNGRPGRRPGETPELILDVAEELVQVRGFNAFSYGDIAERLGITKASLHYHYPSKGDLGAALIARYTARFREALQEIDGSAPAKLDAYAAIYAGVLRAKRMCLCGMLAAEYQTLPVKVRELIVGFFDENERWLTGVLEQGSGERTLAYDGQPRETAQVLIGALEGAMLIAGPYGDLHRFEAVSGRLLSSLAPAAS